MQHGVLYPLGSKKKRKRGGCVDMRRQIYLLPHRSKSACAQEQADMYLIAVCEVFSAMSIKTFWVYMSLGP